MRRTQVRGLVVVVATAALAAALPAASFAQGEPPPSEVTHLQVGQAAPAFKFTDLDGTEHALADLRGRYVLIDFVWWTGGSTAIRSKGEIADLLELEQRFYGKRFAIVGVSMDPDPDAVRAVMADEKLDFPVYVHKTGFAGEICTLYGVHKCPTNFLLDKAGQILRTNMDSADFVSVVGELLKQEPPDPEIATAYNLLKQGQVEAALVKARAAVRDDPCNARTYTLLADCCYAAGDWRHAGEAYLAAHTRLDRYDPADLIVYVSNRLASLWQRADKPEQAAVALERGLELVKEVRYRLQFLYDLGGLYVGLGQLETAAERYLAFMQAYGEADKDMQQHFEAKAIDVEARLGRIHKALTGVHKQGDGGDDHEGQ
jgi:peroxiredoxin